MRIDTLRACAESFDISLSSMRTGEKQSGIAAATPAIFYKASPTGAFSGPRFLNESMADAVGFTADAFVKDPNLWVARIHPDDRKYLQRQLQHIRETNSISIEYRWRCADGSERIFLDRGVLAHDSSAHLHEIIGTCLDITNRLDLEAQQMMQSKKTYPIDDAPKGIVHDFNNILSVILWNLDLLGRSAQKSGDNLDLLEGAIGSALNGLELLRQFSADRASAPQSLKASPSHLRKKQASSSKAAGDIVILVVEDDVQLRRMTVAQIREMGYQALEAADAATALDMLRGDQAVDLLFTDVVMIGGMDGFTLARRVADMRPELRVLITSGHLPAADRVADLSSRFLPKPYSGDELRQALVFALSGNPS